ncbi:peptide synthase [Pseudomonas aeruginosa]|nr:peptide synthase [Pseudomonas aeruginosa]
MLPGIAPGWTAARARGSWITGVSAWGAEQPVLELPADRVRPAQASGRGQRLDMALPVPLSEELLACARREGVTPFMLLLASFPGAVEAL